MKYPSILLLLFLAVGPLGAQRESLEVHYVHTTGEASMLEQVEDAYLLISNNASIYESRRRNGGEGKVKEHKDENGQTKYSISIGTSRHPKYFVDQQKNILVFQGDFLGELLLVEEQIPTFNWQISTGKKVIGSFECTRAVGTHRGREFEAWFTEQIPVNAGPWKFSGLPGLILEVADNEGRFRWHFKALDKPHVAPQGIKRPSQGMRLTFSEYFDLCTQKLQALFDRAFSDPNFSVSKVNLDNNLERTK